MTEIAINGSDTATLHVLHLDLPPQAVERFTTMAGTGEWPLKYAVGATKLRPAFVETVDLRDLEGLGLSHYLGQAYDISSAALGGDKARLDALTGHVVILPPQAFENTSQTLHIAQPLTHIGSYKAQAPAAKGARLRTSAARGEGSGGPASAMGNLTRPAGLVLAALALLLIAGLLAVLL
ncbi:aspartate carbamoyltransferase catalytic subunit [Sagittula sp. SSi028]|uniref:aspartate carbamoyltransferase catalytic subunit n=1 Tax=Sagittula sp. SSi028 TaxID=3400636 RepID=UPI003AF9C9C7